MPGSTADGRRHKGKPYSRESRRSGSRNSTPAPSSAGTTVSVAVDRDRHGSSTSKGGSSKDGPTSGPTDAAAGGDLATSAVRPAVKTTAYLRMPLSSLLLPPDSSLEDLLLDRTSAALDITEDASASAEDAAEIPTARHVHAILQSVQQRLFNPTKLLGEVCDRGMRELACRRKERAEQEREREREREHAELEAEERKMKIRKIMKKKEKEDDRPLAVGAHGVARQDGIDLHHEQSSSSLSPTSSHDIPPPTIAEATDSIVAADSPVSEISHQPAPAIAKPNYQTFWPDPSKFDDPTIYHIREIHPDMTEEEMRDVLCVADYPHDDLHSLTCGTPPDRDFSNAKPSNQTSFSAFLNYVEPYIRPLTDEDIAFLKERGDRVTPFMMPRRGAKHYKEIWAEDDGVMSMDGINGEGERLPPNVPRGGIDQMSDELAETDAISTGPLLARLLSALRPEARPTTAEHTQSGNFRTNGHAAGGTADDLVNGEMDIDSIGDGHHSVNSDHPAEPEAHYATQAASVPPATFFPESNQLGWRTTVSGAETVAPVGRVDYASLEERLLGELRHIGFLSDSDVPEFAGAYDDEVAARLRTLQSELRRVSVLNGARKARLLELAEDQMAMQEYNTIADDLDAQLNAAYLKRNRNLGKGKKQARRPGGAPATNGTDAGAGVGQASTLPGLSRPSVGEPIRGLMERRHQWTSVVGPVVGYGKASLPESTVFGDDVIAKLTAREQESWNEAEDE